MNAYDIAIIGGGVVGVATARELQKRHPSKKIVILEKESDVALHTSGHNSGVLHAGYNQKPGTLKAKLCIQGNRLIRDYCAATGVPFLSNGILVVAQSETEISVLNELFKRGKENGSPGIELINGEELKKREPRVRGIHALWAPSGGSVDSIALVHQLAKEATDLGTEIRTLCRVVGIKTSPDKLIIKTSHGPIEASRVINCAGLHADRIAHMMGVGLDYTIVPFRGEYFKLRKELTNLAQAMIYPVPDLNFPFLGIHWTKTVHGDLKAGPNAILAFGRESYRFWDIRPLDCIEMLMQPSLWKMAANPDFRRLFRDQVATSLSNRAFLSKAAVLLEGVTVNDFERGPSGIRAQLVDRNGRMVDDLLIEETPRSLHVLNAISPGLTCSMAFASHLADSIQRLS